MYPGVRRESPETIIEALTSDLRGQMEALNTVLEAQPDIFQPYIETVETSHTDCFVPKLRYRRSLDVLKYAK